MKKQPQTVQAHRHTPHTATMQLMRKMQPHSRTWHCCALEQKQTDTSSKLQTHSKDRMEHMSSTHACLISTHKTHIHTLAIQTKIHTSQNCALTKQTHTPCSQQLQSRQHSCRTHLSPITAPNPASKHTANSTKATLNPNQPHTCYLCALQAHSSRQHTTTATAS
jgi:hypothetical protein